jgi:hypothetical protein
MSGPGDVIAGLAPPQDNAPAVAYARRDWRAQPGDAQGSDRTSSSGGDSGAADADATPFAGNALAGYIANSWARNKRARDVIEERLLACLRARRGVYADFELGEMWTADAGEAIYLPIAAAKMRQAEAALRDLLLPDGERPWGLEPSALPELPPEVAQPIAQQAALQARQQMLAQVRAGGKVISLQQMAGIAAALQAQMHDRREDALRKEAKERAQRMEAQIEERMERGHFHKAVAEFIQNFATYPAAVLKGPFLRRGRRLVWLRDHSPDVLSAAEPVWTAVSPFDCYPAPEAENCQDGDFIERIRMTRADLYECIGTPGYNEAAIRRVLADHQNGGLRAWLWSDAERKSLEGETHDVWIPDYLVDALHFWGSVEGRTLLDHGITEGVGDPLAYYEVDAVLIGTEVIRCEINDDPLGRRPYHNASYDPVPGAFWGNSIYELMRDCQAMVNACARALNANLGLASGPIMGIDISQLAAGQDPKALRPLQVLQLDRQRAQASAAPIEWYQADSRATELLGIIREFEQKADDLTGVPRYSEGAAQASGAGTTFGGLSMLMGQAAKGFRRAVANIDREVIARTVEAAYIHEMLYNPDESIKGDCTVSARGAAAVLIKEHLQQTRTQFLAMTANPIDMQIVGIGGRRAVLKEVIKALDMPVDDILGSDQEWQARQEQQRQAPPQPTPDARLKSQTDLAREHIRSTTQLGKEGLIHPAAALAAAALHAAGAGPVGSPAGGAAGAASVQGPPPTATHPLLQAAAGAAQEQSDAA